MNLVALSFNDDDDIPPPSYESVTYDDVHPESY
jgi:hypothetical protein